MACCRACLAKLWPCIRRGGEFVKTAIQETGWRGEFRKTGIPENGNSRPPGLGGRALGAPLAGRSGPSPGWRATAGALSRGVREFGKTAIGHHWYMSDLHVENVTTSLFSQKPASCMKKTQDACERITRPPADRLQGYRNDGQQKARRLPGSSCFLLSVSRRCRRPVLRRPGSGGSRDYHGADPN